MFELISMILAMSHLIPSLSYLLEFSFQIFIVYNTAIP
ncbi:hypothetical protein C497_18462 [Halalkalicoccus jeotgali B3]|uniref:Uncharacterized protein n=1 Tax=Halalkalicoccus jeotgali (strain DSM 18796 / CECT 7217 / JCM 14584 / KCTC 4019 / B3) TaxID=795797 RepID=D8J4K7_HALJB|nr:hypothetical protein HacjB3_00880 [Halalkalicoccus jeotgali B3]ELY33135.1 hypothetical protein C497_18462 [Halalkalicoccus jeotgali B3]